MISAITNIGKTDPSNRMFVKTYFQLTNKKLIETKQVYPLHRQEATKDHQGHFELALKIFKENKLFGLGPKGFRYYCRGVKYDPPTGICSTHPHNIILQIGSELGVTGLLIYIFAAFF